MTVAPEVVLGRGSSALRLEVVEHSAEQAALEVRVAVRGFTAAAACDVAVAELRAWHEAVAVLHATLGGRAVLSTPAVELSLTGDGRGGVTAEAVLDSETGWGDGERAVLRATLPPLDQTDLPPLLALLHAVTGS